MRLTIATIGRLKDDGETGMIARYQKRIDQTGRAVALGPLRIIELSEARHANAPQRKADEASRLFSAAGSADRCIALDETGQLMTSAAFAEVLRAARDDGTRETAFLIGGPDGHGEAALSSANLVLALGRMTLPHGLARVVLVEQIYRALTIISGHPYHRA